MRSSFSRLTLSVITGFTCAFLFATQRGVAVSVVIGWDLGAALLLGLSLFIILRSNAHETKARAAAEDPGRTVVWLLVCVSSAISLFASAVVLRQAKGIAPEEAELLITVCLGAVILAWLLTHTAFTLRYARLYYGGNGHEGGLEFPGEKEPDDFDFAYFAFTIGMTFQVSDVAITGRRIRRTVLFHSLLSFAYNTALVALALNVFFGLLH